MMIIHYGNIITEAERPNRGKKTTMEQRDKFSASTIRSLPRTELMKILCHVMDWEVSGYGRNVSWDVSQLEKPELDKLQWDLENLGYKVDHIQGYSHGSYNELLISW